MKLKPYKSFFENITFKNADEVREFISSLSIPRRKPKNIDKWEHDAIAGLKELIDDPKGNYTGEKEFQDKLIMNKIAQLRLPSKEDYLAIYGGTNTNLPEEIKGKYATYIKNDAGSYKRFEENIKNLEEFFSTLKGYHKIPLKNLKIRFVSSKDMKVPAKYKSNVDTIWVNPLSKKVGNTVEEYGSLRYILLHELGHRFLKYNRQSWNISSPRLYTTKYSQSNAMTLTEEESFAELFAITHWKNKYKQYKNQIEEFEKLIEY